MTTKTPKTKRRAKIINAAMHREITIIMCGLNKQLVDICDDKYILREAMKCAGEMLQRSIFSIEVYIEKTDKKGS